MGEFLDTVFDDNMYVLGVFAGAGSFHNTQGEVEKMSPPDSLLDI